MSIKLYFYKKLECFIRKCHQWDFELPGFETMQAFGTRFFAEFIWLIIN